MFKKVFSTTGATRSSMSSTKAYRGGEMWFHSILTSVLDGGKWLNSRPAALPPRKNNRYPLNWRLGEPQILSGRCGEEENGV